LEGHTPIVLPTVRVMCHLTEPVTLLHTQAILMVLMALVEDLAGAEDLAEVEDLAEAEDLAEEDGDKLYNETLRAVLVCAKIAFLWSKSNIKMQYCDPHSIEMRYCYNYP